ncbi:fatty acid desaturase family protein [Anseongella ginsenosidimutans]|nr:acyl-CoA desaturase [Anseongella ginsenosidimutans]
MVFKTVFFIALTVVLYALILTGLFPLFVQLMLAIALGVTMAFVGFNICHDALHGAYSSNKKVNKGLGLLFNIIGANGYLWGITHNIVHHTYTNIPGHDEDIEIAPGLIRVSPEDKANKIQRYQHIYAFFLYGFTSLSWFFRKDYVKFFKKRIGNKETKHPRIEYFNLFFYKIIYYSLFIVIPLLVLDITWWQFLIGYLAMNFAEGYVLGLVFQLAHVVEDTNFPHPDSEGNIQEAWAVHQMMTTANFAGRSNLAHFLCGGLNLQIEHHLFPKICHIHYKGLSGIVKETALEFGLPYHENRNFFSALRSHYFLLKRMGKMEERV